MSELKSLKTEWSLWRRFWSAIIPESPAEREFWLAEAQMLREHAEALKVSAEAQRLANKELLAEDAEYKAEQEALLRMLPVATKTYSGQATFGTPKIQRSMDVHVTLLQNSKNQRSIDYKVYDNQGRRTNEVNVASYIEGKEGYRNFIGPWLLGAIDTKKLGTLAGIHII